MNPRIETVAALKRLAIGTRLNVVRSLLGPCAPSARVLKRVQSNALVLTIADPAHKHHGDESYLWLGTGTKVRPTDKGFAVIEPESGEVAAEYEFVQACTCDPGVPVASDLADLCPICGVHVTLNGKTTDGRLIGSCGDAFTQAQWDACPTCGGSR